MFFKQFTLRLGKRLTYVIINEVILGHSKLLKEHLVRKVTLLDSLLLFLARLPEQIPEQDLILVGVIFQLTAPYLHVFSVVVLFHLIGTPGDN